MKIIPDSQDHPALKPLQVYWPTGRSYYYDCLLICVSDHAQNLNLSGIDQENKPIIFCFHETSSEDRKKLLDHFSNKIVSTFDFSPEINWPQHIELLCLKAENYLLKYDSQVSNRTAIHIHSDSKIIFIDLKDIIYIALEGKNSRRSIVHTTLQKMICSQSLSYFKPLLDKNFIQINRHTIINSKWIAEIDRYEKEVILKNQMNFSLGRAYEKSFMEMALSNK
ncbi:MAG: LytTR family transcriptional regulator DNA-binding domain-containing protein [Saprospiraceae bacterium]|nr:LytTR family transcriptional regulator DNA-binding domain-containing protein [Saprospiraceae bacterium]